MLKDGSHTTLNQCLERGHWVRLQVAAESTQTPVMGAINVVNLASDASDGLVENSRRCLSVRMATSPMCAPRTTYATPRNCWRC